ncbi:MAG: hypothetical protein ACE15B_19515 [Bryobacteraceae bacterium]
MRSATLKADPLGSTVPRNPRLVLHGSGKNAYLWIGNDHAFVGVVSNAPATRAFLRKALARMEKPFRRPR